MKTIDSHSFAVVDIVDDRPLVELVVVVIVVDAGIDVITYSTVHTLILVINP